MTTCLLGLGSNVGDRCAILNAAIDQVRAQPQVTLLARSSWFRTAPVGGPAEQGEFVNAAACMETSLAPDALWRLLCEIEQRLGRQRHARWGPRTVDLDLLLYGDRCQQTPQLTLPHPRLAFRRFALEPAAEVAPHLLHPVLGRTILQLLQHLNTSPYYLALTGAADRGKTALAEAAASQLRLRPILTSDVASEASGEASARRSPPVVACPAPDDDELDLLHRRAASLDAALGATGAISDFWLGQSLAYGRLQLTEEAQAALQAAWQRLPAGATTPRLIVLLAGPDAPAPDAAAVEVQLRALVCGQPIAPFLVLPAADRANALAEVTAAAQAMR